MLAGEGGEVGGLRGGHVMGDDLHPGPGDRGVELLRRAVAGWIRHLAAYQRAPQKFHATVTRAWVEIVAHHMATAPQATDFVTFAGRHPALLDKRLLTRHYSSRVLASPAAKTGWAEPDLAPFPW